MPKTSKYAPDPTPRSNATTVTQSAPMAKKGRRLVLNLLLVALLVTAITLLARPAFQYPTPIQAEPSSLVIVSATSNDYFVTAWMYSAEPLSVGDPVSITFTVQHYVAFSSEDGVEITKPPISAANGKSISFILVDSLATSLIGCSSHVNGAITKDTIAFDSLSTDERDVVTEWISDHPLTSADIEDQAAEDDRSAAARELKYRRLSPTNPVPIVARPGDDQQFPAIRYDFECTFSPDDFWREAGSSETFSFPAVHSIFLSDRGGQAVQRVYRQLDIQNSVSDRYTLSESTIEPAYNDGGYLTFYSTEKSESGNTARLASFEAAFVDTQQQKLEAAFLFIAGILAGVLSDILVRGIYALINR